MSIEYAETNYQSVKCTGAGKEISKEQALKLREKTGMGLLECKYALKINDGDEEKAIKYMMSRRGSAMA